MTTDGEWRPGGVTTETTRSNRGCCSTGIVTATASETMCAPRAAPPQTTPRDARPSPEGLRYRRRRSQLRCSAQRDVISVEEPSDSGASAAPTWDALGRHRRGLPLLARALVEGQLRL